ncbi:D-Ala-D-Ala carboxypeptidase family metallohydrolase [Acinetobacter beijerinckii]|uniref:D-Ala-D-Ala carboxypeptidase family metallohydrolase n=1 Tax=Acinetobacter beijerinckii TaxID=262668 RepID=UPI0024056FE1|nr:D-Ala-D-Ala carboxypeptidase family metallohydrolase [Acinetobacter beijerinckii]
MKKIYMLGFICCLSACQSPNQAISFNQHAKHVINTTIPKIILKPKPIPASYQMWTMQADHQQQIQAYKNFLKAQGIDAFIPDFEFFQTAKDWQKCNYVEYEVPPRELWNNIVPTLNILHKLLQEGRIDQITVTSVYRSFALNQCAGGAGGSKHVFNAALDFRIGSETPDSIEQIHIENTKKKLCEFWIAQGEALNMGLGVYASGQIHIDTAGYRTWGVDHRYSSSPCMNNFSNNNNE